MGTKIKATRKALGLFPPWFLSKEVLRQIEALLPYYYHKRLRFYFDRHGCLRCERKDIIYGCSGLCLHCVGLISDRLKVTDKRMKKRHEKKPTAVAEKFLRRRDSARQMLRDLR